MNEIIIRQGLFKTKNSWVDACLSLGEEFVIVSDNKLKNIAMDIAHRLKEKQLQVHLIFFDANEKNKNQKTKEEIEAKMFQHNLSRDCVLIALGGGVVLDLVGFIAATFCRGIKYIQVPTTLLAMVDACVGGKRGINTPFGKNLIGTFYPADFTFVDVDVLKTLPLKEMKNGLIEMIKHSLVWSRQEFQNIQQVLPKIISKDLTTLEESIKKSIQIKKVIVLQDEKDRSIRKILNFGHTIGHMIEKLEDYQIAHGKAVAIGLQVESYLSFKRGVLSEKEFHELIDLIDQLDMSLSLSKDYSSEEIRCALLFDKKTINKIPHFVCLSEIGEVHKDPHFGYTKPMDQSLEEGLLWMKEKFLAD